MKLKKGLFIPFRFKLMIPIFLLITIPFLISGLITYQKYSENEDQKAMDYSLQIIEQIKINLDNYIKDMERLTTTLYYDDNVMKIINDHNLPYQNFVYITNDEKTKMNSLLYSLAIERSEVQGVFIFSNDGGLFSNRNNAVYNHWNEKDNPWMSSVKHNGELSIIPSHEVSYYVENPKRVVSVVRMIRDPYTLKPLGIIKVDLTIAGIQSILSKVTFSPNSKIFVFDRLGQLIYPESNEVLFNSIKEDELISEDATYLKLVVESSYSGLKVLGLIPKHDLRKDVNDLSGFTIVISIISLLIAYIVAAFLSNHLIKPILYLQKKMRSVQRGDFKERAIVRSNDEVGKLTESFNTMVGEIGDLVKEVYEIKLREREAELNALQSQINPHFIFNTLESMNMLAIQMKNFKLSTVITSLGKLIRYTVDKQERIVYLRDEIAFIDAYLQIQSFRLGESLTIEYKIDPSHEYGLLPKLILQPLIENVIEHGTKKTSTTIKLSTILEVDDLYIYIEDNGVGMTAERIELVERRMYSLENDFQDQQNLSQKKKGFAMRNIHQRIYLQYGEPYGLFIDKKALVGTRFFVKIPFSWEE